MLSMTKRLTLLKIQNMMDIKKVLLQQFTNVSIKNQLKIVLLEEQELFQMQSLITNN